MTLKEARKHCRGKIARMFSKNVYEVKLYDNEQDATETVTIEAGSGNDLLKRIPEGKIHLTSKLICEKKRLYAVDYDVFMENAICFEIDENENDTYLEV